MTAVTATDWGLLVKDIVVLSTRQGVDWWIEFRHRFEPIGRITTIPGTSMPQGDHVWIRCGDPEGDGSDSQSEAEWLRESMVGHGLPKTAVTVCRRPKSIGAAS
jgi:hypothetical protein